jgi:RHS repeat-associated protein
LHDCSDFLGSRGKAVSCPRGALGFGLAANRYADNTFAKDGFTVANGTNSFTASAQDNYRRTGSDTVNVYLPATATFQYDGNGNLLSDGTKGFEYDDENQLIRITSTNSWKSEFVYDGLLRRRVRKEYSWSSGSWILTSECRYVYDGMLPVQERDANNVPQVTYTRGLDLSSTLQRAGGIGGMLARTDASGTCYYHADGGGNVTTLINNQQVSVAKYLYDPFGKLLSLSGPIAEANTYRFSSKDSHERSGLLYFGFRFYEPTFQRWINRDPIEESGGINLYSYVRNNPINNADPFGWAEDVNRPAVSVVSGPLGGIASYGPPTPDPRITAHDRDPGEYAIGFRDFWFSEDYGTAPNGEPILGGTPPVPGAGLIKKFCKIRKVPGRDGATSSIIKEVQDGQTISVTHQVVKDGKVIHQHQTHIGKHGTERGFPDEWVEYPTIPK